VRGLKWTPKFALCCTGLCEEPDDYVVIERLDRMRELFEKRLATLGMTVMMVLLFLRASGPAMAASLAPPPSPHARVPLPPPRDNARAPAVAVEGPLRRAA
jgi:hypothetical protein